MEKLIHYHHHHGIYAPAHETLYEAEVKCKYYINNISRISSVDDVKGVSTNDDTPDKAEENRSK